MQRIRGVFGGTVNDVVLTACTRALQAQLAAHGFAVVTTEVLPAPTFYFAEDYHQQYLAKNPNGYCGLGGTGVEFETATR